MNYLNYICSIGVVVEIGKNATKAMPNRENETYANLRRSYKRSQIWQNIAKILIIILTVIFAVVIISAVSQFISNDIKIGYLMIF
jgi:hypothetical protein